MFNAPLTDIDPIGEELDDEALTAIVGGLPRASVSKTINVSVGYTDMDAGF